MQIVFEPDLKSYFINSDGQVQWVGSDMVAIRLLVNNGFPEWAARKGVLYARMNQGLWIDLDKFIREAFKKNAITEKDIQNLLTTVRPSTEKKTKDDIKKELQDLEVIVNSIPSTARKVINMVSSIIERELDENEILRIYNILYSWNELLMVVNASLMKGIK